MIFDVAAVTCFTLFLVLGFTVSRRPLGVLDARAVYFRSQDVPVALIFTKSGRSRALLIGYLTAFAVFAIARLPIWIPLILAASQVGSQIVVESFKRYYRRIGPDYWLVGLEAGNSYLSGDAATAVVSFVGWAIVLWALGIMWSRLALGTHYFIDVAGSALFGSAWLCAVLAFLRYH